MALLKIYTRSWCEDSQAAGDFLEARGMPFEEIDIERRPDAVVFVEKANEGKRRGPTFDMEGRTFHGLPFSAEELEANL